MSIAPATGTNQYIQYVYDLKRRPRTALLDIVVDVVREVVGNGDKDKE